MAADRTRRVGSTRCRAPFSCTYTVAVGKRTGDVADAPGVVEVDVGDDHAGQVAGVDAELRQRGQQHLDRALAARLDENRPLGPRCR